MTSATLTKEKHLIGVAYIFRGLVHYHHGVTRWQSADTVLKVLHLDLQATGSGLSVTLSKT